MKKKRKKLRQTLEEYESSKKEEVAELSEAEKITEEIIEGTYNHASLKDQEETASSSEESKSLEDKVKETAIKMASFAKDVLLGAKAEAQEAQNQGTQAMCVGHYIEQGVNLVKSVEGNRHDEFCNHVILLRRFHKEALEELAKRIVSRKQLVLKKILIRGLFGVAVDAVNYFSQNEITLIKERLAWTVIFLEKINEQLNGRYFVNPPITHHGGLVANYTEQNNLLHLFGYTLREYKFGKGFESLYLTDVFNEYLIDELNKLLSKDHDIKNKIKEIIEANGINPASSYLSLTNVDNSLLNRVAMPALVASLTCGRNQMVGARNLINGEVLHKTPLAVALDGFVETFNLGIGDEGFVKTTKAYNNYMASLMEIGEANSGERYDRSSSEVIPNSVIEQAEVNVQAGIIDRFSRERIGDELRSEWRTLDTCLGTYNRPANRR